MYVCVSMYVCMYTCVCECMCGGGVVCFAMAFLVLELSEVSESLSL